MTNDKMVKKVDEERNYTVYMHTSPSGKRYIGITSMNPPEKRWNNGYGYQKQVFYKAVQKYGWENINHEILFESLTKEEAEQKEIELIAYYKSDDCCYGYNVDHGGNCIGKHSEETRKKISKFASGRIHTEETRRKMSELHKNISNSTRLKMSQSHKNIVYQYNKNGELVKKYNSILEASIDTGIRNSNIVSCLKNRQKTAGGYIWKYEDNNLTEDILLWHNGNKKQVCQYSKDGEFIKIYNSIKEANHETGAYSASIVRCCNNEIKTAGGYIWRYLNDKPTKEYIYWCNSSDKEKTRKPVVQYSKDGEFIKQFDSIASIEIELKYDVSPIIKCCKGRQKTSYGYMWRYADEELG